MEIKPGLAAKVSAQQVLGYLQRSDRLNTKYTGPDWLDIGWGRFTAAADAEWAEFLDEITGLWKWYSTKPKVNRNKALYELVDWFLFTASAVQSANPINGLDGVAERVAECYMPARPSTWGELGSITIDDLTAAKTEFVSDSRGATALYSCWFLAHFLDTALSFIGATPEDFDRAYLAKYHMCFKRVEGGILTGGSYRKDEEVYPVILED